MLEFTDNKWNLKTISSVNFASSGGEASCLSGAKKGVLNPAAIPFKNMSLRKRAPVLEVGSFALRVGN